jgi:hypothetical protein
MIKGHMKTSNGKADMWFWEANSVGVNQTGTPKDMYVTTTGMAEDTDLTAGAANEIKVGAQYGITRASTPDVMGWYIYFVRPLTTADTANDVQFTPGKMYEYAIAVWNGTNLADHFTSFDKTLIVGNALIPETVVSTVTVSQNVTVTAGISSTTSAFEVIIVVTALIAVPVLYRLRKKT